MVIFATLFDSSLSIISLLLSLLTILSSLKSLESANSRFTYNLDEGFPISGDKLGGITGIDVGKDGNIIIFHRGSHVWDLNSFDTNDIYLGNQDAPIPEDTVITIDVSSNVRNIINSWGSDMFFMPHGLSLDPKKENVWLTDVALHQVFKFPLADSNRRSLLTLGTRFVPGNDESHFCKPTSVADTGDFVFVADGYCNSRIMMFSSNGRYLSMFGQASNPYPIGYVSGLNQPTFSIPHKIVYAKEAKILCVADRENGRIQIFNFEPKRTESHYRNDEGLALNGAITTKMTIEYPEFNGKMFSLDYSPISGGIIAAVSGFNDSLAEPAHGFVFNVTTGQLISRFNPPGNLMFGMAHDIAFSGDAVASLYVVDVTPVNLWKFSRPLDESKSIPVDMLNGPKNGGTKRVMSMIGEKEYKLGIIRYFLLISAFATVIAMILKTRKFLKREATYPLSSLYSNSYPSSVNSLFGSNRIHRRMNGTSHNPHCYNLFSKRNFLSLFNRGPQQNNDFSRIPMEDSDNSDDDKSDSDIEEFNINQTVSNNIKINV